MEKGEHEKRTKKEEGKREQMKRRIEEEERRQGQKQGIMRGIIGSREVSFFLSPSLSLS